MKVGDYVRYKYENCIYIGKIKFISEVMGFEETLQLDIDTCMEEILKENIIKSSQNIIDLIEYDDVLRVLYDNEEYICKVVNVLGNKGVKLTTNLSVSLGCLDIKSIVTREMFERMEYKVNE